MRQNRVVITGMGWVTPLGWALAGVWRKLLAGTSAIEPIRRFDASTFPTTFAAEVPADFDYRRFTRHSAVHEGVGPNVAFTLGAARQAWDASGLSAEASDEADGAGDDGAKLDPIDPEAVGVYLGSGEGMLDFENYAAAALAGWDEQSRSVDSVRWAEAARRRLEPQREIVQDANMPVAHLAMEFNAQGPAFNCLTACAASTQAVGEAAQILRRGDAQAMITGGSHTMIHPLGVTGFNRLTALSNRNDDPASASRPFSHDRDGFVLGEGAGILILETLEHVRQRGAEHRILAEIVGYGSSADAFRITDIPEDGHGAVAAMKHALEDAGLRPQDIDYISAHGTGTKENDSTETFSVKQVFGGKDQAPPMSSIKSMMGHLIAAAGAVEMIACALAIRDQKLPPTINLHTPDPECDLDNIPNAAHDAEVNVCLSNSFGFGGQNDAVIIRRFEPESIAAS